MKIHYRTFSQSINHYVKNHIDAGGLRRQLASAFVILFFSSLLYFITFLPIIKIFDALILYLYHQTDDLELAKYLMCMTAVTGFSILFHLRPLLKIFSVSNDKDPIRPGPFPLGISGYIVTVGFLLAVIPLSFMLSAQECNAPVIEISIGEAGTVKNYSPPEVLSYYNGSLKSVRIQVTEEGDNPGSLLCSWEFDGVVERISNKKGCIVDVFFHNQPGSGIVSAKAKTTSCSIEKVTPVIFVVQ